MFDPGDVIVLDFPGAVDNKRRPAVVLSTATYHLQRPDVILGLLTTQVNRATTPTDYVLLDWTTAGLHQPSAFRSYVITADNRLLPAIGHLSERDWQGVQACLSRALTIP